MNVLTDLQERFQKLTGMDDPPLVGANLSRLRKTSTETGPFTIDSFGEGRAFSLKNRFQISTRVDSIEYMDVPG